jgi:hypothetical protein
MNALALLQDLEVRGVVVTPRGGNLIVDAPAGTLTAEDRDLLHRLKPDLLAILEASRTPDSLPPDWHQLWDERAAVMEYDGKLPRERAEALALADILNQMYRAGLATDYHA